MNTMCLDCKNFLNPCTGEEKNHFTGCVYREVVNCDKNSLTSEDIEKRIKQITFYFAFDELEVYRQLVEEGITPTLLIKRGMFKEAKHMREFCASHW